jgi:hypothetical protein
VAVDRQGTVPRKLSAKHGWPFAKNPEHRVLMGAPPYHQIRFFGIDPPNHNDESAQKIIFTARNLN